MNKRYIIGAVVAAIIAVAVIIPLSLSGGDDDDAPAGGTSAGPVAELLQGIPQDGTTLGRADAPVEIVEYADAQCPVCADASATVVRELIADEVRKGEVKMTLRPIVIIGPDSERGVLGVEAAALQDRAWNLSELLYERQGAENEGWLSEDAVMSAARDAGLDMGRFEEDYASDEVAQKYFDNQSAADAAAVSGTPTFVITGPGGEETIGGLDDKSAFDDAIAKVAAQ